MLSFILLFDIYAGWIMKNYLHVTLYCFDLLLVDNLIKSDHELKNQLYDYFLSNYTKEFNDSRTGILFILD